MFYNLTYLISCHVTVQHIFMKYTFKIHKKANTNNIYQVYILKLKGNKPSVIILEQDNKNYKRYH